MPFCSFEFSSDNAAIAARSTFVTSGLQALEALVSEPRVGPKALIEVVCYAILSDVATRAWQHFVTMEISDSERHYFNFLAICYGEHEELVEDAWNRAILTDFEFLTVARVTHVDWVAAEAWSSVSEHERHYLRKEDLMSLVLSSASYRVRQDAWSMLKNPSASCWRLSIGDLVTLLEAEQSIADDARRCLDEHRDAVSLRHRAEAMISGF